MNRTPLFPGIMVALFFSIPVAGRGQEEPPPPVDWSFEGEVGASVFFGASDQTTVATKLNVDRKGRHFEVENDLSYLYGEATTEDRNTFVNKRSWSVATNADYQGFSRVNPYFFSGALSSLEKAIKIRYKGGAGAKLSVLDTEETRLNLAVAILGERTVERAPDNGGSELLARWTGALGFRRSFSEERTVLEAKADYNPVFDQFDNYTIQAESSVSFRLSEIISLRLSVVDNYDSRAVDRGARDNNDGRVLFSVLSSF